MDETLINRFDHDGDCGTDLNRFLVQAVVGHPLTVHGTEGQTRAFIYILDNVQCVKLAIHNPPEYGEKVEIFNQATETHSIKYLAQLVSEINGAEIRYYRNPRKESPENDLLVRNKKFLKLGLNPIYLEKGLLDEVMKIADKYKHCCDYSKIISTSCWCDEMDVDCLGSDRPI